MDFKCLIVVRLNSPDNLSSRQELFLIFYRDRNGDTVVRSYPEPSRLHSLELLNFAAMSLSKQVIGLKCVRDASILEIH